MARALLKLATILSLVFSILLQASSSQMTLSSDIEDDDEEYVLDSPPENFRSRSRFLASVVRKGTRCNAERGNVCNGVSANKGTSLIYCCKKHCRNVLGDKNNCGICGNKCRFAESCCNGRCTNIFSNVNHCGKCTKKCAPGVGCHYGTCGYV
ncbi:PROTEIN GRIM REAPER [Salix koriyanagi]|uniref:PROTEIN GRIM REAPER n=1 Tax=Salix koriyanagi TaxID=2511006 RepID=A0A9Q0X0M9_9ROSI|nr:PROTEIN GRIM REAPER [Salix koriyanagi]